MWDNITGVGGGGVKKNPAVFHVYFAFGNIEKLTNIISFTCISEFINRKTLMPKC